MPIRCAPWPVNRNAGLAVRGAPVHQARARLAALERGQTREQRRRGRRATTARRGGRSASARPAVPRRRRGPPRGAPRAQARRRAACARSAPRSWPRRARAARRRSRSRCGASAPAASSRMTCALVPLMPKEETPARRGRLAARPGLRLASAARPRPPPSRRAASARRRAGSCGSTPCRSASTILITPPTPAAAWVWPMLDLSEPSQQRRSPGGRGRRWRAAPAPRSGRRAWCRCRAPRRRRRRSAVRPASASAWRITRSWAGPLGAVRPLRAPSWLTARAAHDGEDPVPVAARVGQPLQHQHARALGPAGAVGGGRERLAAAVRRRARAGAMNSTNIAGERHHGHAAGERERALAADAAPGTARCSATSEEEQAVSTVTAGPSRPST